MAKYVAPSDLENLVELAISNSVKVEALLQLMVGKGVFAEQEITDKIQELRRKLPRRNRNTEDVLEDITELLEESAGEFVVNYVQKPGK
ncbi:MAG: ubiquitin-like protein Pup [Nitrospirota bacterium]|nr:ubiquitin-like protein Pup [Nitrospirota bacterium]